MRLAHSIPRSMLSSLPIFYIRLIARPFIGICRDDKACTYTPGLRMGKKILSFSLDEIDYLRLNELAFRSVEIKRGIVDKDPYERNIRKALNLGHTIAHSFESFAMADGKPVQHGYAVAWGGMIVELYLSHRICCFPKDKLLRTVRFIHRYYGAFNITCDHYEMLYEITKHDKKRR